MADSLLDKVDAAARVDSRPDCPTEGDLLAFIPGHLSGAEAGAVEAHLQTCGICQSRVTTLRKRLSNEPGQQSPVAGGSGPSPGNADPTIARSLRGRKKANLPKSFGPYELLHPIGRGGMGIVYKGYHPKLRRNVAIKLLPGLQLSDATAVVRLKREQAAAGRVEHENIVYAFDAGEQDGIDYLVMEFVDGIDLSRLVAECGPLPIAEACEIVRQAALGLAHLESRGLVHRDIKPSNLMLSRDGVVKILDLGLARLDQGRFDDAEATQTGFFMGTADYVSPEQIDDPHSADIRSDLYSLGCTLYKILCGRAPFWGDEFSSINRKLEAHRREDVPEAQSLREGIPPALNDLLIRLLSKDPSERPQKPADVASELARHATGADLEALSRSVLELSEPALPRDDQLDDRSTDGDSTARQGRTPTPVVQARNIKARPQARWAAILWVVAAVGLLYGLLHIVSVAAFPDLPDEKSSALAPPVASSRLRGTVAVDLRQPLEEQIWPGHQPSPAKPQYDEDTRMLDVRSDSHRLLKLGEFDGTPGKFEVTIRQIPWYGHAGLFFGYRHKAQFNKPQVAVFQLFAISQVRHFDPAGNELQSDFGVLRSRSVLDFNPIARYEEALVGSRAEYPEGQEVRLSITFRPKECVRVTLNGEDLLPLASPEANQKFSAADYRGPWGIYHGGGEDRTRPTWFGNIVFTPLENER